MSEKLLIQDCISPFDTKVNFIDSNNVVVGYDMAQNCCETFGWKITSDLAGKEVIHENDAESRQILLDDHWFDTKFLEKREEDSKHPDNYRQVAIFKLNRKKQEPVYLHLYNDQNGYYSHGFTLSVPVKSEKI